MTVGKGGIVRGFVIFLEHTLRKIPCLAPDDNSRLVTSSFVNIVKISL